MRNKIRQLVRLAMTQLRMIEQLNTTERGKELESLWSSYMETTAQLRAELKIKKEA